MAGSGHYSRMVPVKDIRTRIWAKILEDNIKSAKEVVERAQSKREFDAALLAYKNAQYLDEDQAIEGFSKLHNYRSEDFSQAIWKLEQTSC